MSFDVIRTSLVTLSYCRDNHDAFSALVVGADRYDITYKGGYWVFSLKSPNMHSVSICLAKGDLYLEGDSLYQKCGESENREKLLEIVTVTGSKTYSVPGKFSLTVANCDESSKSVVWMEGMQHSHDFNNMRFSNASFGKA